MSRPRVPPGAGVGVPVRSPGLIALKVSRLERRSTNDNVGVFKVSARTFCRNSAHEAPQAGPGLRPGGASPPGPCAELRASPGASGREEVRVARRGSLWLPREEFPSDTPTEQHAQCSVSLSIGVGVQGGGRRQPHGLGKCCT